MKKSDGTDVPVTSLISSIKRGQKSQESEPSVLLECALDTLSSFTSEQIYVSADEMAESPALYLIDQKNVVGPLPNPTLDTIVYSQFPKLSSRSRKEVVAYVKAHLRSIGKTLNSDSVQPVAFADEPSKLTWNRLSLTRSGLQDVALESLPGFAHILSLCDDPDALVLWIGSLLDPKAGRTQYLHLHGAGANGKSTLFEGIERVLGSKHVTRTRSDEFANQHWGSSLEGVRLLIFSDENNPGFFSSGKFKEFTGEATVTVNPKHKEPRTIHLTHKTAVFSNNKVEISTNIADRRRLLSITMQDDPDSNVGYKWWYDELKNQGERILAYCFNHYEAVAASNPSVRAFITPSAESIAAAIERKYENITDIIKEFYDVTLDPEHSVKRSELHAKLAEETKERRTNRIFQQQLKEALTQLGVSEGMKHGGQSVYKGIRPIRAAISGSTLPRI